MGRSPCCDKATVKRGPWSAEENARLRSYIHQHGTGGSWIALPRKAGLRRCGKSCRLRWLNYLRPDLRHGGFSPEEDRVICTLYAAVGSRWSLIAAHLPGRTDNGVKNYWNTRLKKKLLLLAGKNPPPPPHGHRQYNNHAANAENNVGAPPPLVSPLPPWSSGSQPYDTTSCGGGVDQMHVGAGGGTDMMITGTKAATAAAPLVSTCQDADTSYDSCVPAATELDEIFRSIVTSGGEHSAGPSQSSTDMEAFNWYHCLQGETVLQKQQQYLGMPYSYW